jgi:hypothetical protein
LSPFVRCWSCCWQRSWQSMNVHNGKHSLMECLIIEKSLLIIILLLNLLELVQCLLTTAYRRSSNLNLSQNTKLFHFIKNSQKIELTKYQKHIQS